MKRGGIGGKGKGVTGLWLLGDTCSIVLSFLVGTVCMRTRSRLEYSHTRVDSLRVLLLVTSSFFALVFGASQAAWYTQDGTAYSMLSIPQGGIWMTREEGGF